MSNGLSWLSIVRLGLVQTGLGAIIVLMDSTINRVMVVELGLAATLPGLLLGLYYAVQLARPRLGYGSDLGNRRSPWIIGGMAVLAAGGFLAAIAVWVIEMAGVGLGLALGFFAFFLVGLGSGSAGTSLLTLVAKHAVVSRRAPAATILWIMMILGFIITAVSAGSLLDPFSTGRLVAVTGGVALIAFGLSFVALWGVEPAALQTPGQASPAPEKPRFLPALKEIWGEGNARRFTIFVFVSMLAYSAQDLLLEPFAGQIFGFTPGESTKLTGTQYQGALLGMIFVGVICSRKSLGAIASLRLWTVIGCIGSALALSGLVMAGLNGGDWPLKANVFLLGLMNGLFAIGAIGSMMDLAGQGRGKREGMRMGLWGASQAVAMGGGKFLGTVGLDVTRLFTSHNALPYMTVFAAEAVLFIAAAVLALSIAGLSLPGGRAGFSFNRAADHLPT